MANASRNASIDRDALQLQALQNDPARRLNLAASPKKDQYIACSLLESNICVLADSIPANLAACDAPEEPLDPPPTNIRGHGPTSDAGATATRDQGTPDPATTTTDGMEVDTDAGRPRKGTQLQWQHMISSAPRQPMTSPVVVNKLRSLLPPRQFRAAYQTSPRMLIYRWEEELLTAP